MPHDTEYTPCDQGDSPWSHWSWPTILHDFRGSFHGLRVSLYGSIGDIRLIWYTATVTGAISPWWVFMALRRAFVALVWASMGVGEVFTVPEVTSKASGCATLLYSQSETLCFKDEHLYLKGNPPWLQDGLPLSPRWTPLWAFWLKVELLYLQNESPWLYG